MLWIMVEAAGFNPSDAADDQIIWTRTADGCYSAKSAYLLQFEGCVESFLQKQVWKVWVPSRSKFFMWLLLQKRIWTVDRLLTREWINQYFCLLCRRNMETAGHLFLECPFSRQVWEGISIWLSLPRLEPRSWSPTWEIQEWFVATVVEVGSGRHKGAQSAVILVCWLIWREWNSRIFICIFLFDITRDMAFCSSSILLLCTLQQYF
jgi:hypothetical protein